MIASKPQQDVDGGRHVYQSPCKGSYDDRMIEYGIDVIDQLAAGIATVPRYPGRDEPDRGRDPKARQDERR
jgi:hypothetical protein